MSYLFQQDILNCSIWNKIKNKMVLFFLQYFLRFWREYTHTLHLNIWKINGFLDDYNVHTGKL